MEVVDRQEAVFYGNPLTILPVQFDQRASQPQAFTHTQRRPGAGKGSKTLPPGGVVSFTHRSTRPSLSWVGCQGRRCLLLPMTRGEIEYIAGDPPAWIGPLVAVLLPPSRHADSVRVKAERRASGARRRGRWLLPKS